MFYVGVMSTSDDVYLKAVESGDNFMLRVLVRGRIGVAMQRTIICEKLGIFCENYVHYFVKYVIYNNRKL